MLCLGKAVMHTGEIDLAAPINEVRLFGEPRVAPCVIGQCITLALEAGAVNIGGANLKASQCVTSAGFRARDDAGSVRIDHV